MNFLHSIYHRWQRHRAVRIMHHIHELHHTALDLLHLEENGFPVNGAVGRIYFQIHKLEAKLKKIQS